MNSQLSSQDGKVPELRFRGNFGATLDAKGRMALPARFRGPVVEAAEGRLVVTVNPRAECLYLYPLFQWEMVQDELEEMPNAASLVAQQLQRLLIGHATDLELDGSGRVLLPQRLRQHCDLEKALVVAGVGKKIEIWAEQKWKTEWPTWKENVNKALDGKALDGKEDQSTGHKLLEISL